MSTHCLIQAIMLSGTSIQHVRIFLVNPCLMYRRLWFGLFVRAPEKKLSVAIS